MRMVDFIVYTGCLYDADGNAIASDTLYLNPIINLFNSGLWNGVIVL